MNNLIYVPGHFSALAATPLGTDLWEFLNGPETWIRFETATSLGRPAVEAIEEPLLSNFGDQVLQDRVKQMIGHMTRQIMESHGYVIDQQDVKMTGGAPFTRGTRYIRRDQLVYFAFQKSGNPRSIMLTLSRSGVNLEEGGWRFWRSFNGELRACVALGLPDIKMATQEMRQKAFYLHDMPRVLRAPS